MHFSKIIVSIMKDNCSAVFLKTLTAFSPTPKQNQNLFSFCIVVQSYVCFTHLVLSPKFGATLENTFALPKE